MVDRSRPARQSLSVPSGTGARPEIQRSRQYLDPSHSGGGIHAEPEIGAAYRRGRGGRRDFVAGFGDPAGRNLAVRAPLSQAQARIHDESVVAIATRASRVNRLSVCSKAGNRRRTPGSAAVGTGANFIAALQRLIDGDRHGTAEKSAGFHLARALTTRAAVGCFLSQATGTRSFIPGGRRSGSVTPLSACSLGQ